MSVDLRLLRPEGYGGCAWLLRVSVRRCPEGARHGEMLSRAKLFAFGPKEATRPDLKRRVGREGEKNIREPLVFF